MQNCEIHFLWSKQRRLGAPMASEEKLGRTPGYVEIIGARERGENVHIKQHTQELEEETRMIIPIERALSKRTPTDSTLT